MKDRIRQLRQQNHLTQAEFSVRIGKTPGFISLVENGRSGLADKTVLALPYVNSSMFGNSNRSRLPSCPAHPVGDTPSNLPVPAVPAEPAGSFAKEAALSRSDSKSNPGLKQKQLRQTTNIEACKGRSLARPITELTLDKKTE